MNPEPVTLERIYVKLLELEARMDIALPVVAAMNNSDASLIQKVKRMVEAHYGLAAGELETDTRQEHIRFPRQVAMFILHTDCQLTALAAARAVGRRDHGTVYNAVTRVADRIATESKVRDSVNYLRRVLTETRNRDQTTPS